VPPLRVELLKKPDYIDLLELYLLVKEYLEGEKKDLGLFPGASLWSHDSPYLKTAILIIK